MKPLHIRDSRRDSRAFTLIELLVVILILALVVAIIVPALGGARNAAKGVSSRALLTQVANASSSFANDHDGALPGYFSAGDMGDGDNADRGFTEMENILLDLAGGLVPEGGSPGTGMGTQIGPAEILSVGPTSDATVNVNLGLIGAETGVGGGGYFTPDAKQYRPDAGQVGEDDHQELPDLIDAWSTPVLAWRRNQFGPTRIESDTDFATEDSSEPAWFYWNSNAGFLNGKSVGKLAQDQQMLSMLGEDALTSAGATSTSLTGFLGSPAYPDDLTKSQHEDVLPTAARGDLVFHSAGADGVYLGTGTNGSKQFSGDTIDYYRNFFNAKGVRLTNDDGEGRTEDILGAFDDLIQTGN